MPANPLPNWKLPIYSAWRHRVGRAIYLWDTPCAPTWQIWAKAAGVAFPRAFASVIKPFPLAETWHEISNTRDHGRKSRRRRGTRPSKPPFGFRAFGELQSLGKPNIPGWGAFEAFGDAYFKGFWYLLLADTAADGALNWVSTAYQMMGCINADDSYAIGTGIPGELSLPGGGSGYIDLFSFRNRGGISGAGPTIAIAPGYMGHVGGTITTGPNPVVPSFPVANFSARIIKVGEDPAAPFTPSQRIDDTHRSWTGSTTSAGFYFHNPITDQTTDDRGSYTFEYQAGPGALYMTSGSFTGYGHFHNVNDDILPDP